MVVLKNVIFKKEQFISETGKLQKIPDLRICHREEGGAGNLSIDVTTEKRFESDIEEFFLSSAR